MSYNKFGNTRTTVDNISFASKKEAKRYTELKLLERAGEIEDLKLQPRYPITFNGMHICTYVGDFQYLDRATQRLVTEDVKGVKTDAFVIKAKLFHALTGREVTLV